MGRRVQRLAIIIVIIATFIAYLSRVPNSEGIEQINRIRGLAAVLKLTHLLVCQTSFLDLTIYVHVLGSNSRIFWYF